jgi:RNA polymerase sigma-70 factor (ECF subfamily)
MKPSLEAIWNDFAAKLGQFIRARVADSTTAEDILQDVYLKLQERYDELHDPAKVQGWLILVARNTIIDHYRTRKRTSELQDSLAEEAPCSAVEEEELKAIFHRMIYSLPEPYRCAIILTEFEGLTQIELAKRLHISVSGAKSRVQRGREQLKQMLLDYCHREFSRAIGSQPCPKGLLPAVQPKAIDAVKRPPARPRPQKDGGHQLSR